MSAHRERAEILLEQGRHELAEQEAGLALAEDPDDFLAHGLLAQCLLHREQFGAATDHARQAVGLAPDHAYGHYVLAVIWANRNHLDKAEEAIRTAVALQPEVAGFRVTLAMVLLARKQWQESFQAAEEALALDAEHLGAMNVRAQALRHLGRAGDAEKNLLATLSLDPDDAWTHANLGWTYLEKGNYKKAREHFREALRLNPELEWAREGVVETMRASNPLYRPILKYFLLMQRLGNRGQWMVILGLYLAYQLLNALAAAVPSLGPYVLPLMIAYLVFALGTWLARPLMTCALRLHPFGRLALSRDERTTSNWFGGLLITAVLAGVVCLIRPMDLLLRVAIVGGAMLLPLGLTMQTARPYPRRYMLLYTLGVGAFGLVFLLAGLLPQSHLPPNADVPPSLRARLTTLGFGWLLWGSVLSWLPANLLQSKTWRK